MSSVFLNGLNTNSISSLSSENNLLLGGTNTNNIQLLNPIIGDSDNNIRLNNDTSIKGNTTIDGNVSVNGIVTNSTPITLSNQLTPKSYVDNFIPIGTIIMYASLVNPPTGGTGYYLCDGSEKNITTDAALFAVIGYTYGRNGDNFNLPNLLGKFPVGPTTSSDMTYLSNLTGGVTTGNVTLTTSNLPPHTHTFDKITFNPPLTGGRDFAYNPRTIPSDSPFSPGFYKNGNAAALQSVTTSAPTFTFPTNTTNTTIDNGFGNSTLFSITPPYTVVAYYIKR